MSLFERLYDSMLNMDDMDEVFLCLGQEARKKEPQEQKHKCDYTAKHGAGQYCKTCGKQRPAHEAE
jgi:hypothetical protein